MLIRRIIIRITPHVNIFTIITIIYIPAQELVEQDLEEETTTTISSV